LVVWLHRLPRLDIAAKHRPRSAGRQGLVGKPDQSSFLGNGPQ
jgi:hypothetical protein